MSQSQRIDIDCRKKREKCYYFLRFYYIQYAFIHKQVERRKQKKSAIYMTFKALTWNEEERKEKSNCFGAGSSKLKIKLFENRNDWWKRRGNGGCDDRKFSKQEKQENRPVASVLFNFQPKILC